MKVVCFSVKGNPNQAQLGVLDQALIKVFDLPIQTFQEGVLALIDIHARGGKTPPFIEEIPADKVELLAPIPHPRRNIFCVGLN